MKQAAKMQEEHINPVRKILPLIVIIVVLLIFSSYVYVQKENTKKNTDFIANEISEYVANNIANEVEYAESSIKLTAVTISQTMTSEVLENPSEVIFPMIDNTPFGSIEYIQTDGMNVMNIGEPFDASDRVYYKEGIKGNTGIWNNYHPKTSKETLMNFYTPLIYEDKIAGVITGYIEANRQILPLFETKLYGKPIHGVLIDENNMVICSTMKSEFIPDYTLDMFMDQYGISEEEKEPLLSIINDASEEAKSFNDSKGEGRISVSKIQGTNWKAAVIIPSTTFDEIINENTSNSLNTIFVISGILFAYAAYILIWNIRRRNEISKKNEELEEENERAFNEISEIRDIIASANMGTWRIELVEGKEPKMYADDTMKMLLGIAGESYSPEKVYTNWYSRIKPEAVDSVLCSVEKMQQGYFDENTYLWIHPTKGERYVRCGGTAQEIIGGYLLKGYHYDVDDVVREDQAKVVMLQSALDEKNEYYSTLGMLGDIFYSMHVIDLKEDKVVEFNAKNEIKEIVNHKQGAVEMMINVMSAVTVDKYKDEALEFTNLTTIQDRMQNKKIISKEFVGKHIGWFLASFITMEKDEEGKPTKLIYTTRNIDEEKKQEATLIRKSHTDEITGLLNRRAYEEDIYEHNDIPVEDNFIYVSLDVNGLKVVNDTLGHTAGDEMIIGACQCMKESLGPYGRLYRIGGDEFVAILFCDENDAKKVLADFDDKVASWKGKLIDSLSISYGFIDKNEQINASVRQLGAIAEQRMYDSKSAYYKKMGVDRRGQQDAHKALCDLYTKILKINITDDTYQIINMDMSEQTIEKGFSDSISKWLESFGHTGQVHPDDLEGYLKYTDIGYMKEYFMGSKTSLHIFYRRKFGEVFKQVMMELIPANDYSDDSQSLFLYVKNIDK